MRILLALALVAAAARAERLVTVRGEVLAGSVRIEDDQVHFLPHKRRTEKTYPLSRSLLVERDDGTVVWSADFDARLRAYEFIARARTLALLVDLTRKGYESNDGNLAREVFEEAERYGYTGKKADVVKKRIESLETRHPKVHEKRARKVKSALARTTLIHPDLLVARARVAVGDDRLRILRAAFGLMPRHQGAVALLKELAPAERAYGTERFWLDFELDLRRAGATLLPPDDAQLGLVRFAWRKDLYGAEASPIRVFTAVRDTRIVGRCMAYGRLVCMTLSRLFAGDFPRKRAAKAATLLLYGDRKEYLAASGDAGGESLLKQSAGHYSPAERLSRLYWDEDPDIERRIVPTFVHELTHHWIQELSPAYADSELKLEAMSPGLWIVEGIAEFMAEGSYDIETGTVRLFDARARSLDRVHALSKKGELLD